MTLPLLVSVPHAGLEIPERLAGRCLLSPQEVIDDGDVGAREIYAIADEVAVYVTTAIARAVLDMNRAEDDRRRDGIVKTHTCWNVPIWSEPLAPADVEWLFDAHYRPYHAKLTEAAQSGVRLGIDLHTMAAFGPPVGPDAGRERPAACIGDARGTACPPEWSRELARCLEAELERPVTINEPFAGGYITRTHAAELPWVQVELSRAPFLSNAEKRARMLAALEDFCRRVSDAG